MNAVADAINSITTDPKVRAAMYMGSALESSQNPSAVGDNGTSYGAFQIHLPAHPGVTATEAQDPTFSARYMLSAYQAGVGKVQPSLWSSDPALAAATAAYYAERPAEMYSGYATKWSSIVQPELNGQDVTAGGATAQTVSDPFGIDSLVTEVEVLTQTTLNYVIFGIQVIGGTLLLTVGLYLIFKQTSLTARMAETQQAIKTVASAPIRAVKRGVSNDAAG